MVRAGDRRWSALAGALSDALWVSRAEILKQDERSSVLAGDSAEGPIVVKSLVLDRARDGISRLFGMTRLMRQWRGAERLAALGFHVATPMALWRGLDDRGRCVESFAMRRLEGRTLLQHLAARDLPAGAEEAAAMQAGSDIAMIARSGLLNRDHKPSNLLLLPRTYAPNGEWGACRIAILDTVGVRRERSAVRAADRMLFSLIVECLGTGVAPRVRTKAAALRAARLGLGLPRSASRALRQSIEGRLARHGDPTPKVNPLA